MGKQKIIWLSGSDKSKTPDENPEFFVECRSCHALVERDRPVEEHDNNWSFICDACQSEINELEAIASAPEG